MTSSLLYDRIMPLCCDALNKFPNVNATLDERMNELSVEVTPKGRKTGVFYTVSLDEADVEEEEMNPDRPMRKYSLPKTVKDHVQVLDVCLAALAADEEVAAVINDLTTDGDGNDCEAIFDFGEEGYINLKVR